MENYYRVAGYYPNENVSFIADSNGKYEKLWQLSAYLKSKGCEIIAVSRFENMIDDETPPILPNVRHFFIRTCAMGTPTWSKLTIDGNLYTSLRIGTIEYVPDITQIIK